MDRPYTHFGIPYIKLSDYEVDHKLVKEVPEAMARAHGIVAMDKFVSGPLKVLTVAMRNPEDHAIKSVLQKQFFGFNVLTFKATPEHILEVLNTVWR